MLLKPYEIKDLPKYEVPLVRNSKFGYIYFLYLKDELVYIGQTTQPNPLSRIGQHFADKIFDSFRFIEVERGQGILNMEGQYIKENKTKYNKEWSNKDVCHKDRYLKIPKRINKDKYVIENGFLYKKNGGICGFIDFNGNYILLDRYFKKGLELMNRCILKKYKKPWIAHAVMDMLDDTIYKLDTWQCAQISRAILINLMNMKYLTASEYSWCVKLVEKNYSNIK